MLEPDTHLGRYRLIGRLGAGGMGEVWRAEDTQLGRTVAIKILPPAVASDPDAVARMRREARTAAQLYHPNIATIHAIEEVDGRLFIVMEYVEGEPLSALVRRGGVAEAEVCRIGRAVADALAEAHAKGIVHRDIKPDNVIVNGARVKVLDFGIAKQVGGALGANDPTAVLTQAGMIIGTVLYMSPEQALGKPLDARSDLFSLGVVIYELATGRLPFRGETITETITKIVRDEPEPPRGLSSGLEAIIRRCLAKDRERRFASAAELASALERQLAVAPTTPYTQAAPTLLTGSQLKTVAKERPPARWPWIAGVVVLVLAAAFGGFVIARNQTNAPRSEVAETQSSRPPEPATAGTEITTTTAPEPPAIATATTPAPIPIPTTTTATPPTTTVAETTEPGAPSAPPDLTAAEHLRIGLDQLRAHRVFVARREFAAALRQGESLEPRQRLLAEIGLAIAAGDRHRARELGRELNEISPRDPDLLELVREFGDEPPPPRPRPFVRRRP